MRTILITGICLLTFISCVAQNSDEVKFSGILKIDAQYNFNVNVPDQKIKQVNIPGRKSPFLAGTMSLLIPGAGEVYTKNYMKAAIFVAVEAAAIAVNVIYNKKGDDKTVEFKNYGDANWSAVKYAEWLNTYAEQLSGGQTINKIYINPDQSLQPWQRVDFKDINEVEEKIPVFSHKLVAYGEQQYYELIGKYLQYKAGWADYPINESDYWNYHNNMFYSFSDMFLEPDRLYQVASTAVIVIVTNHFLSALDAAWSASRYNKTLIASVEMKQQYYAGALNYYPQLNLQYRF